MLSHFLKAGLLALLLIVSFLVIWEFHWRSKGFPVSYNDDETLWADKRAMVYESKEKATVFIGASRIKFDLDIPEWEKLTGEHAIQLACVGSSPRLLLKDLADDHSFNGKLVIDVTEGNFFIAPGGRADRTPTQNISYYKKITPAQETSFVLNCELESKLVFLQKNTFSLGAFLDRIPLPQRTGVVAAPVFPKKFSYVNFNRQTTIYDEFVHDTNMQRKVTNIWSAGFSRRKPLTGDSLQQVFNEMKLYTNKIRQRGGQIIFVRPPSNGRYLEEEKKGFPRDRYWDRLLSITGCPGIHFEDYPEIAHFTCPEWSHLKKEDGVIFTRHLVRIIQEKGWTFANKRTASR